MAYLYKYLDFVDLDEDDFDEDVLSNHLSRLGIENSPSNALELAKSM